MGTPKDQLMSYGTGAALVVLFLLLAAWARKRVSDEKGLGRNAAYHGLVGIFLILSVWTLDVYLAQAIMMFNWPPIVTKTVDFSVPIVIAIIVLRQVFLLIDVVSDRQMKRGEDETSARIFAKVMKMISTLILLLILGDKFGFNLSGLLAFGGAGGIIIGLAAKDMLSNVFSGMMLFYDRQFDIGDWISSPDRNIEGTVLEVGWRQTKILTFDKRPLYVPNSLFSTISVENPGRMRNRRIKTSINLRYEDASKVGAIVDDIHKMLQEDDAIDSTQTMLVNFNAFGPFSLEIMVYCFTKTTQWAVWLQAQQTVFLNIIDIVHKHGADFAYETQTLYLNPASRGAGAPSAPIPPMPTTVSGAGPVG